MRKAAISLSLVLFILFACSKNGNDVGSDCTSPKSYAADVSPIIASTCATSTGCHASGSTNGPGALTSYQQVSNNRSAIRASVIAGTMPQNGSLSSAEKNSIICWIDNGAQNN